MFGLPWRRSLAAAALLTAASGIVVQGHAAAPSATAPGAAAPGAAAPAAAPGAAPGAAAARATAPGAAAPAATNPPVTIPSVLGSGGSAPNRVQTGMWFLLQPPGALIPAPPTVPPNGLWVASLPIGPIAMSAVRFQMKPGEAQPILTLTFNNLTTEPTTPIGTGQFPIVACPITSNWTPTGVSPGAWADHPAYDCSKGLISGLVSNDKKTLKFDLTTITKPGQLVDLALIPGNVSNSLVGILPVAVPTLPSLPSLPDGLQIPNPFAAELPSTFDASFNPPVSADLDTILNVFGTGTNTPPGSPSAASGGAASGGATGGAGADDSLALGAPGTSALPLSGTVLTSPAPALAAPSAGGPATSGAEVAPTPTQVAPVAAAADLGPATSSSGRRILAALVFLGLVFWAFELLVRQPKRRVAPAAADEGLTIGAWMQGSSTSRRGDPPPIS